MRVAIVHDWLYVVGGAERVLKEILQVYPNAQVFSLFDVLTKEQRQWIGYENSKTSFLQRIPKIHKIHRLLLPLMPLAIEQLDLSGFDLIISSSYAVAKGVITGPDQVHIAYVHSPMRYAWDLQHQYLNESRGRLGIKSLLARPLLHKLRIWDSSSGLRADAIVANSAYISRRIRKTSGRESSVINPPVAITRSATRFIRQSHFLTAGRLVSYKNTAAVVEAFKLLPDQRLIVAGTGPEEKRLRALAGPNVAFAGFVDDEQMRRLMGTAQALIFAAEEDFGIMPVEAQSEGTPVLALGKGGARETIVDTGALRTGMFFDEPTAPDIAACVNTFLTQKKRFTREACLNHARLFSAERFRSQFKAFVEGEVYRFRETARASYASTRRVESIRAAE